MFQNVDWIFLAYFVFQITAGAKKQSFLQNFMLLIQVQDALAFNSKAHLVF